MSRSDWAQPTSEVHLWYFERSEVDELLAERYRALLSAAERQRYERFLAPRAAFDFVCGRALLRCALSAYCNVLPEAVDLQITASGKPMLGAPHRALSFSLTHAGGLIGCAVTHGADVGLDTEEVRETDALAIAARFFARTEYERLVAMPAGPRLQQFFRIWTLKEACLKAQGTGLATPLETFVFCFDEVDRPLVASGGGRASWQLTQFPLTPRHLAALAVRTEAPTVTRPVIARRWLPLAATD